MPKRKLLEEVREVLRIKNYSYRTEKSYIRRKTAIRVPSKIGRDSDKIRVALKLHYNLSKDG